MKRKKGRKRVKKKSPTVYSPQTDELKWLDELVSTEEQAESVEQVPAELEPIESEVRVGETVTPKRMKHEEQDERIWDAETHSLAQAEIQLEQRLESDENQLKKLFNRKISSAVVYTDDIVDQAVTGNKLADRTIDETKLKQESIGTHALRDYSVVNSKLGEAAVTSEKIAHRAIEQRHIANDSITGEMIQDKSISGDKIILLPN